MTLVPVMTFFLYSKCCLYERCIIWTIQTILFFHQICRNWISLYCNDDLIWVTGECITLSCSALYFANLSKVAYEPFYQHIIYLVLIYVFHNAFARCFSVQIPQYDTP